MSSDEIRKCSSGCQCSKGCNGCPVALDPCRFSESTSATIETLVLGVAPVKMHYEVPDMGFGAEGGCEGGCP